MRGRTHYLLGILYYLLFCLVPIFTVIQFSDFKNMFICILASAVGALFPDADSDHSLINSRNPIFKTSNKTVNYLKELAKKIFAFIFFIIPCVLIIVYMYKNNNYSIGLIIFASILFILSIKGVALGEKIYIPIFTNGLRIINAGAAKIKKAFMVIMYLSVGIACIYFSKGSIEGIVWGIIFAIVAIFPHRTFLHSPEGIVLVTIGVKYLEKIVMIPNISLAFFIGYFSHLYLADIFTSRGVPISTIPLILKKIGLHNSMKKNKTYMRIYNLLNKKLSIPLIKTGSKLGNTFEGLYVFLLFVVLFSIIIKNRAI